MDHVLTFGPGWPGSPARIASGGTLPQDVLAETEDRMRRFGIEVETGCLG